MKELPFTITITAYNNKKYLVNCIQSALNQKYNNFDILYIDDASSEASCIDLLKNFEGNPKITLVQNSVRLGKLNNIFININKLKSGRIVLELDGDDYLINDNVLSRFNQEYKKNNLVVYANYMNNPPELARKLNLKTFNKKVPYLVKKFRLFRKYGWIYSGLRSYYAGLFHKIKKGDLLFEDRFLNIYHDAAMLYPMLEMAGTRISHIAEPMLIRNIDNPINDFKFLPANTDKIKKTILTKPKYEKFNQRFI